MEDLHALAIKRRRISGDNFAVSNKQEHTGPDQISSDLSVSVSSNTSPPVVREQSGPDLCNLGSRKRVHPGPEQTILSGTRNATTAGLDDHSVARATPKRKGNPVPSKSLKRKLKGPFGSDPDARASHSLRIRTDPVASLQRFRATPLDPYLGMPTNTQHPNTVVEPDD